MQHHSKNSEYLTKLVGATIRNLRSSRTTKSMNKLSNEYDISQGHMSKIENGHIGIKLITLWKIAEALEMSLSELIKKVESQLPEDFSLTED